MKYDSPDRILIAVDCLLDVIEHAEAARCPEAKSAYARFTTEEKQSIIASVRALPSEAQLELPPLSWLLGPEVLILKATPPQGARAPYGSSW